MPTEEHAIRKRLGEMHAIARLILSTARPVIAAVDGFAVGSGLSVMAACDQVVVASNAQFCASFQRVGLVGDVGLLWTLPRRISLSSAKRLLLLGEMLNADDAFRLGLVDEIVEPGATRTRALELATQLASGPPLVMAATKRLLDVSYGATFDELLDAEMDAQIGLLASADFDEGRTAFFDRRPPRFTGQ
jgi:enoyl-CoA hydratase/carnithine racemase